jgi:hypothetical protein
MADGYLIENMNFESGQKWLFVVPYFLLGDFPRIIRVKNISKFIGQVQIHILALDIKSDFRQEHVIVHRLSPHWIHRIYLTRRSRLMHRLVLKLMKGIIITFLRIFIITDIGIFDSKRIQKEIAKLERQYKFDKIIFSILPYSLFSVSNKLEMKVGRELILDIGDPLCYNSANRSTGYRAWRKKRLETKTLRYAQKIIVTNQATKSMYSQYLRVDNKKIYIVPQGYSKEIFKPSMKSAHQSSTRLEIHYYGALYKRLCCLI